MCGLNRQTCCRKSGKKHHIVIKMTCALPQSLIFSVLPIIPCVDFSLPSCRPGVLTWFRRCSCPLGLPDLLPGHSGWRTALLKYPVPLCPVHTSHSHPSPLLWLVPAQLEAWLGPCPSASDTRSAFIALIPLGVHVPCLLVGKRKSECFRRAWLSSETCSGND